MLARGLRMMEIAVVAVSAMLLLRPASAFYVVPATTCQQQERRVSAFSVSTTTPSRQQYGVDNVLVPSMFSRMVMKTRLHLAAVDDDNEENSNSHNGADDATATAASEEEPVNKVDDGSEEEEAEDPEITALKEEIASLETELKMVRRQAADVSDRADDFTQPGYARKVAEMENMRRARSMLQSSNKDAATAAVVTEFLPVLDQLTEIREKYDNDEFGRKYTALAGGMRAAFTQLGVTEYTVAPGEPIVDPSRVVVVESEYSDAIAANSVLRPVTIGMELQGNVVRPAECVASLGAESLAVEEKEEEVPMAPEDGAAADTAQ